MSDFWLSGPVEGIHPLLQPVAHALLQVQQDAETVCSNLREDQLWMRIGDSAAIGFHVIHLSGSTDRLFTYARGEELTPEQTSAMKAEKILHERKPGKEEIISTLKAAIDRAFVQLRATLEETFTEGRVVGRAKLPSTVLGLLFHAAEHAQRHNGQIATTARILQSRQA